MIEISETTAPMQSQLEHLAPLLDRVRQAGSASEKLAILDSLPYVEEALFRLSAIRSMLSNLNSDCQIAIKSVLACGQGPIVFQRLDMVEDLSKSFGELLEILVETEKFYDTIGGIIGYHVTVLKLISEQHIEKKHPESDVRHLQPEGWHLFQDIAETRQAVRRGIELTPNMAEIYPIGGAGDRLMLVDEQSGEPLPAAQLLFCGRTLLEGLIRDLQAREYLYYKLFSKQISTPIALMTSFEKNNYHHIKKTLTEMNWFGRPKNNFIFFTQSSVPVITKEGIWAVSAPLKLILKPGGHGIIWKLGHEYGIFGVLQARGRNKAIVRQINNPVAGTDNGLLALIGIGCHEDKALGFASCPRLLKTPEGTNVLIERKTKEGYSYCLTNIEYTEFRQKGIQDMPEIPGSPYSAFPSNTNILFVDLKVIGYAAETFPFPGMLINMKSKFTCLDAQGTPKEIEAGRLESTMQNVADYLTEQFPKPLSTDSYRNLKTFITFNERRKTISVAKTHYSPGGPLNGTPEGCFFELMQNQEELLTEHCAMKLPAARSPEAYLKKGPSFIFLYHPALGPLYEIIGQKIKGGSLAEDAELTLDIAELSMIDVHVDGSLIINAEEIMGDRTETGKIRYSGGGGKCTLKNVKINNKGIDRTAVNTYWKNAVKRTEEMRIIIQGNGEFVAEDVEFDGDYLIEVPTDHRLTFYSKAGNLCYKLEEIKTPSWHWKYRFDDQNRVVLSKEGT